MAPDSPPMLPVTSESTNEDRVNVEATIARVTAPRIVDAATDGQNPNVVIQMSIAATVTSAIRNARDNDRSWLVLIKMLSSPVGSMVSIREG